MLTKCTLWLNKTLSFYHKDLKGIHKDHIMNVNKYKKLEVLNKLSGKPGISQGLYEVNYPLNN